MTHWWARAIGVPLVVFFLLSALIVVAPSPVLQVSNEATTFKVVVPERSSWNKGVNVSFHVHVFNATGYPVRATVAHDCYLHVYNENNRHLLEKKMYFDSNGVEYAAKTDYVLNDTGEYGYLVYCNGTKGAGFTAATFLVSPDGRNPVREGWLFGLVPFLFALLGVMLLVSSFVLGAEHSVLRIGLFLLSFFPVVYAINLGMMAVYRMYGVTVYGDNVSDGVVWAAWIFGVILFYFVVYVLVKALRLMVEKRKQRLEY